MCHSWFSSLACPGPGPVLTFLPCTHVVPRLLFQVCNARHTGETVYVFESGKVDGKTVWVSPVRFKWVHCDRIPDLTTLTENFPNHLTSTTDIEDCSREVDLFKVECFSKHHPGGLISAKLSNLVWGC